MPDVRIHAWTGAAFIAALAGACSERSLQSHEQSAPAHNANGAQQPCAASDCNLDEQHVFESASAFLTDISARRDALEASLLYTDNTYAQERLTNYAIVDAWESRPVFDVPAAALHLSAEQTLIAADYLTWAERTLARTEGAWPQWSLADWLSAGKAAFFHYPNQRLAQLDQRLAVGEATNSQLLNAFGLWRDSEQTLGGLVNARYADGSEAIALTCATCHAQVNASGRLLVGAPSRLDISPSSDVTWGPGKIDVTADGVTNPVAIADLRATRVQRRLHHTGNVANSLLALAVRVETLLITNFQNAVRPPRELAFALAVYIWSLGSELASDSVGLDAAASAHPDGANVFEARCASCHAGVWGEGEWVPVAAVQTDPLAAESSARGTGGYRVPALLGFADRPLSHEARTTGLAAWLNGETLDDTDSGHAYLTGGTSLSDTEVDSLTAYLLTAFASD